MRYHVPTPSPAGWGVFVTGATDNAAATFGGAGARRILVCVTFGAIFGVEAGIFFASFAVVLFCFFSAIRTRNLWLLRRL